jgi:2-polyprenyl-3-methyl-5-hydroxy-6-metoxy-1,4-benzoquinol methylase
MARCITRLTWIMRRNDGETMKTISEKIVCPKCKTEFDRSGSNVWKCKKCGYEVKLLKGKPVFTPAPDDLNPTEFIERGPEKGTIWRRFNWGFIEKTAKLLTPGSEILDVGAGRGDFKPIFAGHSYLGLDIYPYPEIDLAVDLIQECPFKENSFDLIVLANVIEHIYDYRAIMARAAGLVKPGGRILVTVPFMLKLHQEPVDYHRYTRYALAQLAADLGLELEILEGYYNPLGLLDEGIGNAWQFGLPQLHGIKQVWAKAHLLIAQKISNLLKRTLGNGYIANAAVDPNPNVLGYQVLFRKNK